MTSPAGRKKPLVSSTGIKKGTSVANNNLSMLNKGASSSYPASFYAQCYQLRTRLLRIKGLGYYFSLVSSLADSPQSIDAVTHIWDLFSLGISLCYLVDLLEGFPKINNSRFDPKEYDAYPNRARQHAIALFVVQIDDKISGSIPGCELLTVTDLWDRNSMDGPLVKVRARCLGYTPDPGTNMLRSSCIPSRQ